MLLTVQYLVAAILSLNVFSYAQLTILPFISFICASKIHRCWIVYGQNIRVIIIPSILAFAYLGPSFYLDSLTDPDLSPLAMWLATIGSLSVTQNEVVQTVWGTTLALTSLITSMTVNALVTGLIVLRIFKVFREVQSVTTSEDKSLSITRRNKLRSVIFIIIESGMALLAIQLARVVISAYLQALPVPGGIDAAYYAFQFIVVIHELVNVNISSVIVTLYVY